MIGSVELARIIQEGIAAGMFQNTQVIIGFIPNMPFIPEVLSYPRQIDSSILK